MPTIKKRALSAAKQTSPQFEDVMHQATGLYGRFRAGILSTLGALLAIAIATGGYLFYEAGRDRAASDALSRAMGYYEPVAGGQPDYQKALQLFRQAGAEHSGTLSGAIASYYAGNCLMSMGRFPEAVKEYQDFVDRPSGGRDLLGLVHQRLGYALISAGDREQAMKAFEKAESILGAGMATSELAVLYERSGRPDDARKKYQVIADALAGTAIAEEAKTRLGTVPEGKDRPAKAQ